MKVKIGPYPDHWTTSNLEHWFIEKRYKTDCYWEIEDWPRDQWDRRVEKVLDVWQDVLNATVNKHYFWKKKRVERVKLDRWDHWSADHTLALVILPTLKQLRENLNGAGFVEDEDVPEEIRSTSAPPKENDYDTDDFWHQRWEWVLDEMIFAFEMKVDDDWESEFHTGEMDMIWIPLDKDGNVCGEPHRLGDKDYDKPEELHLWRMERGENDTSEWDREGQEKVQKRISNGFRLFGKYYEGLWD